MKSESPKTMSYFAFLALPEREQNGFFILTLDFDKSKVVTEGFWENGEIVGVSKDYEAWDYILHDNATDITSELYELNPLTQIGFNKKGLTEGEFIDLYYDHYFE